MSLIDKISDNHYDETTDFTCNDMCFAADGECTRYSNT
jgi:hypothetical protein